MEQIFVQGISHKDKMVLIKGQLSEKSEDILAQLRMKLWQQGETPQVQTQMSRDDGLKFCWSMPKVMLADSMKFLTANGLHPSTTSVEECGIITVIGSGFWQSPETLDIVRSAVPKSLLFDIKNNALTIVVSENRLSQSVKALHAALIK